MWVLEVRRAGDVTMNIIGLLEEAMGLLTTYA